MSLPANPGPSAILEVAPTPFALEARRIEVPAGLTIVEMLAAHGIRYGRNFRPVVVVHQGAEAAGWIIAPEYWHAVRPRPGMTVSVKIVPHGGGGGGGKNPLRTVLTLAVVFAAMAAAPYLAGALAPQTAALGSAQAMAAAVATGDVAAMTAAAAAAESMAMYTAMAQFGLTGIGLLAVSALVPPPKAKAGQVSNAYSLTASNQVKQWSTVTAILGRHRHAWEMAAKSYTEQVGDDQYLRVLYGVLGPVQIDVASIKIGDTPLSEFGDYEIETRQGFASDEPIRLFPGTVEELLPGNGLPVNPIRQADGWVVREIPQDADELVVLLTWPNGIKRRTSKGNQKPTTTAVRVEYAPTGTEAWLPFPGADGAQGFTMTAEADPTPRRAFRVRVPRRQYKVRVWRLIDHDDDTAYADTIVWSSAQAILNEAPLRPKAPMALIALRIKVSGQWNGSLSNMTVVATSIAPDYDAATGTWIDRPTRNPASLALLVMRGPGNLRKVPDSRIDWDAFAYWHQHCAARGLTYDAVASASQEAREWVRQICSVGEAFLDEGAGGKISVIVDEPQGASIQLFTPRNSWGFKATKVFMDPPHALKVRFNNEAEDYEVTERIVLADGYSLDGKDAWGNPAPSLPTAERFEGMDYPGVTNPDLIFRKARRHLAEMQLRPETYELNCDPEYLVAGRRQQVSLQHDVLLVGLAAARIKSIATDRRSAMVDERLPMQAGKSYAMRIRVSTGAQIMVGVVTAAGEVDTVHFTAALPASVQPQDLVAFGEAGRETIQAIIKSVYPGKDRSARLLLVDAAPGIYTADQGTVPPYDPGTTLRRLPTPTGFRMSAELKFEGGTWVTSLSGSWDPMHLIDSRIDRYTLQLQSPAGTWRTITPDSRTSFRLNAVSQGTWLGRLWSESADGRRSAPAEAAAIVSVSTAGTVLNIRPEGGAWQTPDLAAVWDCTLDAASPYFGGFRVRVRCGGTELTTQIVGEARFAYAYDRYVADAAAAGVALSRSLTLSVQLLDAAGDPVGAAATATLTNPAHVAVGTPGAQFLGISVDATADTVDPDYVGLAVWVSDTPGINPSALTPRLFDGRRAEVVPLAGNIPVYARWAARDVFGWDPAYVSAEVELLPQLIDTEQLAADAVGRDNLTPDLRQPIDLVPILDAARQAVDRDGIEQARALVQSIVAADEAKDALAFAQQTLSTRVEEGIAAVAEMTTDLVAVVEDNAAIVQQQAQAIANLDGTVAGIYEVKIQTISGGTQVVSGFGLTADATGSAFGVLADRFYIAAPGQPGKYPFAVETDPVTGETTVVLNGVTYAGQINANQVTAGQFTGDRIAAKSIKSEKIDADVLSAISSNLGSITGGSLSINNRFIVASDGSVTIKNADNGARLVITNTLVQVYDANNVLRVRMGIW